MKGNLRPLLTQLKLELTQIMLFKLKFYEDLQYERA